MAAITKNLYIECGTDADVLRFRLKDADGTVIDLTGCKARADIKQNIKATKPLVSFTTDNNTILMDNQTGIVTLKVSPSMTNNIKVTSGVYDLEFIDSIGEVTRIFSGSVTFSLQITKSENI